MSAAGLPLTVPRPIIGKVRRLRWLVRGYVGLEGAAIVAIILGAAFWIGLAIDWMFEPLPIVRVLMWVAVIVVTGWATIRYFVTRAFAPLSDSSLALLVERNYPQLKESLVTTIDALDRHRGTPPGNPAMLRQTSAAAANAIHSVELSRLFRWAPLAWKTGLAALCTASIALFALLESQAFGFWMNRLQLGNELWPRRVQLAVLGFVEHHGERVMNVARDDNLDLQVLASVEGGHVAPEMVEIRYERADGRRGRSPMIRVGRALAGRDAAQQYRYTFQNVEHDLRFAIVGGDDRIEDLLLRVVERPQVDRIVVDCEYPDYLDRAPRSIPVSGRTELPTGAHATFRVRATKPLASAQVHDPAEAADLPVTVDAQNPHELSFGLSVGQEDRVLLVTVRDTEGVESHEPYRVVISAIPDLPPEVSVALRGIGTAITPQATLPLAGNVTDEYGVTKVWYEYQVDQEPAARRDLAAQPNGSRKFDDFQRFDLALTDPQSKRPLVPLSPGQKLSISVKATDAYDLGREPHVGASQRFLLEIVTESELRALLEKRELTLRQQFEVIYEKMVGTRELLDRIELTPPADEPADGKARRQQRDASRIGGCQQNATQLSFETLGVAEGFEDIVAELKNNRVDTEELTTRLEQGISEPLRQIGGELLPAFEAQLQDLHESFATAEDLPVHLGKAKGEGDEVVQAMKQVLDRMLELESYNELVELLRGIVAEQKQLRDQTLEQRRAKLRSILDDE